MITEFPKFKKIEPEDEKEVEKFTSLFPPYSDFNFISLWSWNINDEMRLSIFNGNLIVKFNDYITGKPFLSFIGKNKIPETASGLISFSKKNYDADSLKLVPEEIAKILGQSEFTISPDADSHDYVFTVEHLGNMHNWPKHQSSKGIEKFLKLHPDYVVKISSINEIPKNEYRKMFSEWAKSKDIKDVFESNEYKAFERFLEIDNKNIYFVSLYKTDQLIGFTAYEITSKDYAVAHFSKANTKHHSAIYDILNWEEAKALKEKGVKYYNWEQDLGIEGLRRSKKKYNPSYFLNKFIITNQN